MSDEILVPDSQPSDNDKGKGKAPARQPSALLIDAIAVAADVSSTSEDPPARLSNNKLPDLPWHGRFKPNPPTFIGNVGTNPPLPDIDLPHGKGGCSPYVDHLDTYETLFNELLKDELIESNVLERDVEIQLLITSHRILQAMDTRIIHCLVRGDLPIRYRKDRDVKCIIDTLWRSQDVPFGYPRDTAVQPAIYVQYLTDRDGVGLSAAQYTVLISRMRTYAGMKDPDYALKIDTFMPSQQATMKMIKNGRRKYLNRQLDTAPSAERVGWVIRFCDALEVRVKNEQGIERYPLREVGYSNSAQRRLHEHATHQSSNFLMNLAEVICGIEFPDRFHFDQYVVARLHAPQQAVLAEVLLTRLGSGYIASGRGLSFWAAGKSNASALKFSTEQYDLFAHYAVEKSPILHNAAWEKDRRYEQYEAEDQEWEQNDLAVRQMKFALALAKQHEANEDWSKAKESLREIVVATELLIGIMRARYEDAETEDAETGGSGE